MKLIEIKSPVTLDWGAQVEIIERGTRCFLVKMSKREKVWPTVLERRVQYSDNLMANVEVLPLNIRYKTFPTEEEARQFFDEVEHGKALL